jgi:hypothetical protein
MSEAEEDRRSQIWDRPPHLTLVRSLDLGSRSDTFRRQVLDVGGRSGVYTDHLDVRG